MSQTCCERKALIVYRKRRGDGGEADATTWCRGRVPKRPNIWGLAQTAKCLARTPNTHALRLRDADARARSVARWHGAQGARASCSFCPTIHPLLPPVCDSRREHGRGQCGGSGPCMMRGSMCSVAKRWPNREACFVETTPGFVETTPGVDAQQSPIARMALHARGGSRVSPRARPEHHYVSHTPVSIFCSTTTLRAQ